MLAAMSGLIYWARGGSLSPRTVAERPVWSIWIGYLAALAVVNLLLAIGGIDRDALFSLAAALSGFGFIAMSGHVWGGSAILGLAFLVVSVVTAFWMPIASLLFGTMWLVSLITLGHHYRMRDQS